MSELNEFPFEHTTVKLTQNLLKGLHREADPPDVLDSYIEHFNEAGITDDLQKLHAIESMDTGAIYTLASFVANEHPIVRKWPDNLLRHSLYSSAESLIFGIKIDLAATELNIWRMQNFEEYRPQIIKVKTLLQDFQGKLLERITPTPPHMRI